MEPETKINNPPKPVSKLTEYRCYCLPILKNVYVKLLNDNIVHLLEYIYTHRETEPYNSPEVRLALSMQIILSSEHLIPVHLSTQIAKDIDTLRKDNEYLSKWVNPSQKRKRLSRELELLKKHTEIDDSISLNLPDQIEMKQNIEDFDIHSGISTLNVSTSCPIPEEDQGNCTIM